MLKVKNITELSGEERYDLERNHLTRAMYVTSKLKEKYDEYLISNNKDTVDVEDYTLLSTIVLSKLGYPMQAFGTYLYALEITEIVKRINKQENLNIKDSFLQIKGEFDNHYSDFYKEIIKEKLDMRSKNFHDYIQEAIFNIDWKCKNDKFSNALYKNITSALDSLENAFVLAKYISTNSKKAKLGKYKIKK